MRIWHNLDNPDAEIISDSYKFEYPEQYLGAVAVVKSRMVAKGDVEVDVGCGNAFGGKNEDEEEGGAGGAGQAPVEKVNDLIDNFRYQDSGLDKAGFQAYIKEYLKKMLPKVPADKQANFKAGCTAFIKYMLGRFGEFTIYTPSDYSIQGALIYSEYVHEEDPAPTFYYILDGLPFIKV